MLGAGGLLLVPVWMTDIPMSLSFQVLTHGLVSVDVSGLGGTHEPFHGVSKMQICALYGVLAIHSAHIVRI